MPLLYLFSMSLEYRVSISNWMRAVDAESRRNNNNTFWKDLLFFLIFGMSESTGIAPIRF